MILKLIQLTNFRNFPSRLFELGDQLTVIIGENARGKTNLLESIYFSIYGVGFRETREEELLLWNSDQAMVETRWLNNENKTAFQIVLHKLNGRVTKRFYVNRTNKGHYQYMQNGTKAVLFAPEHIDIVSGNPEKRRDYFNRLLAAIDLDYKKKLVNYERALRKRNKILEIHKDFNALKEELKFWNTYLEEQATYITQKRQDYIDYLNQNPDIDTKSFRIEYLKNELTVPKLEAKIEIERHVRKTTVGPQKDDFHLIMIGKPDKNIHLFGSRSEQRLGVFWLKLNEIKYFEMSYKLKPLLLLDDVFSELDVKNKKLVMDLITEYQTILTTTEDQLLEVSHMDKQVIRI